MTTCSVFISLWFESWEYVGKILMYCRCLYFFSFCLSYSNKRYIIDYISCGLCRTNVKNKPKWLSIMSNQETLATLGKHTNETSISQYDFVFSTSFIRYILFAWWCLTPLLTIRPLYVIENTDRLPKHKYSQDLNIYLLFLSTQKTIWILY